MMCARHNDLSILRLAAMAALLAVTVFASGQPSGAEEFIEPPVFISGKSHVLDILMIARPQTVNFVAPKASPTGWVYQVCYRPPRGNTCPHEAAGLYGGFRLQLQPGDLLKIRLVNKLPSISVTDTANPTTNVERIYDDPLLALNPTNIHTHGLIVDANANSNIPPAVPE
jgi:L-ascorbate oxidase